MGLTLLYSINSDLHSFLLVKDSNIGILFNNSNGDMEYALWHTNMHDIDKSLVIDKNSVFYDKLFVYDNEIYLIDNQGCLRSMSTLEEDNSIDHNDLKPFKGRLTIRNKKGIEK